MPLNKPFTLAPSQVRVEQPIVDIPESKTVERKDRVVYRPEKIDTVVIMDLRWIMRDIKSKYNKVLNNQEKELTPVVQSIKRVDNWLSKQ